MYCSVSFFFAIHSKKVNISFQHLSVTIDSDAIFFIHTSLFIMCATVTIEIIFTYVGGDLFAL